CPFSRVEPHLGQRVPSLHRISLKSLEQVSSLERMSKTSMRKTEKNQPQKSYLRAYSKTTKGSI
ncbi:MAG: hypothetical protein QW279_14880, partial [Candidatus Jordarchaeaceae archaeon]